MSDSPFFTRRSLRRLLDETLPTDVDLEAFCIDYFPEIKRQFGGMMDRGTRLNLLLETAASGQLMAALREQDPLRFDAETLRQRDHDSGAPLSTEASDAVGAASSSSAVRDALSDRLSALYDERATLLEIGRDTSAMTAAILELRRQLRQGPQLQAGEFLSEDRYRLLARIGRGGFSTVWLALSHDPRQPGATKRVAIKVLHSDLAADPINVERFCRGARRMSELQHPHIVRVIDTPSEGQGFHYFVMELLDGGDLHQAVCDGKLTTAAGIAAVLQAGAALQHAHDRGLIHRDVKPENILLDRSGVARLTDFDLVLADDTTGGTRTGALGTFLFAAPEVLEDARGASVRSDVYSLGMTLAFVLYGRRLPQQALTDQLAFVARLPTSRTLRAVVRRAIAADPARRYASAKELCAAIASHIEPSGQSSLLLLRMRRLLGTTHGLALVGTVVVLSGLSLLAGVLVAIPLWPQWHHARSAAAPIQLDASASPAAVDGISISDAGAPDAATTWKPVASILIPHGQPEKTTPSIPKPARKSDSTPQAKAPSAAGLSVRDISSPPLPDAGPTPGEVHESTKPPSAKRGKELSVHEEDWAVH